MFSRLAVAALAGLNVGAVLGEMTHLIALAALDIGSRTWGLAFLRVVSLFATVLACESIDAFFRAVACSVTNLGAIDAGDGWSMGLSLWNLFLAVFLDVAKFSTVGANGDTTIMDKATGRQTLEVLLGRFGPAFGHLDTTRLGRGLDGQNELALGVSDKIDNGHVDSNLLLLGDEEDWEVVVAESSLNSLDVELILKGTGVRFESRTEQVEILNLGSIDELVPSLLGTQFGNASPVDDTTRLTLKSLVAWLVAQLASLRVGRAAAHGVALLSTGVASTTERTLDLGVGAIGLVVTNLTAVEALSSHTTALRLVRAFSSEVSGLVADATGLVTTSAAAIAAITSAGIVASVATTSPVASSTASIGSGLVDFPVACGFPRHGCSRDEGSGAGYSISSRGQRSNL